MSGSERDPEDSSVPGEGADPFELLGVPVRFDLDVEAARSRLRRKVAALHPDRFTDPVEIERVTRAAAALNEAWTLLSDDERRANLVLSRLGGPAPHEDRSLPPEFLQDMLSIRMELEEALEQSDRAEIARLREWVASHRAELRERVRLGLEHLSEGAGEAGAIRLDLNVWRYIERMDEQLSGTAVADGPEP